MERDTCGQTEVIETLNVKLDHELFCLGRGCDNRRRENLGIAKRGGGSDPCQDFWWICRSIPKTLFRDLKLKLT